MNDLASGPPASNNNSTNNIQTTNVTIKSPTTTIPNANTTKSAPTTIAPGMKHSQKNGNKTRAPRRVNRTPKTTTIRSAQNKNKTNQPKL